MATTFYTLQVRTFATDEWTVTDFRKGKKGTVVAEAEKRHASERIHVRVVTDAGSEVFALRGNRRKITRHTPAFTVTSDPLLEMDKLPEDLQDYVFAYSRPRTGTAVLRNMEVDKSERYAVVTAYGDFLDFCENTRAAGEVQTSYGRGEWTVSA